MKRLAHGLMALGLLGLGGPAAYATDKVAPEPAATLLLPYFEVDLGNPLGANTLISINNASAMGVLAHVVVLSDLSVPVLDFNIYLTGYDVQTITLRDILVGGMLPQTASAGQDPSDTISPQGPFSQDANFTSCTGQLPPPPLPATFIQHLQLSLTGRGSPLFGGLCSGRSLGDNLARGYVTVDTVSNCTLRLPSDPAYFGDVNGNRDITDQNVLWGDYFYINQTRGTAEGNPLVHILAELPPIPPEELLAPSRYTFYGRYVNWSGADHRHPLGTNFAGRYTVGGSFSSTTSYIVWRDSKVVQNAFTCPVITGRPTWYPLGQEGIVIFDEQEQANVPVSFPFSPVPPQQGIIPFPAESQRVAVNGADLPVPFAFGWLYLNLNTTVSPGVNPPHDPAAAQAWVALQMISTSGGTFSVGFDAIQLDNASRALHRTPATP
ncbi:MAG TPA: hypothetical protein VF173_32560 [Thermoanaerobaculia bacterium]|nr:hypothetical protein [Thermoanaerobaculia bacterium]